MFNFAQLILCVISYTYCKDRIFIFLLLHKNKILPHYFKRIFVNYISKVMVTENKDLKP